MNIEKNEFKNELKRKYENMFSDKMEKGNKRDQYTALGMVVRDYLSKNWLNTRIKDHTMDNKQVYYFSMEFLIGRLLTSNLINLGIFNDVVESLKEMGIDYYELQDEEKDAGLGNGGLGRLAACFMDSIASLGISGHGVGIRYNYGFFEQKIVDNAQVEIPDNWLKDGNLWEVKRESESVIVKYADEVVKAVPYDVPIVGFENSTVNTLRLWSAEVVDKSEFDFEIFNNGDYEEALSYKSKIESISQILYPDDSTDKGRLLRVKQQYFFVSAGVQNIIKNYKNTGKDILDISSHIAIHINDTHPSMCIPELMRILVDEEGIEWSKALEITREVIGYTNHTILSEALEKWDIEMFKKLLPRIYEIIEKIDKEFRNLLTKKYNDEKLVEKMAIVDNEKVKMAHLAIVGSHSVNGVAKLHTEILKHQELKEFYDFYPEKFNNKTNGITHRRWLIQSNPRLTNFLRDTIGDGFIKNPLELEKFMKFENDKSVRENLYKIKMENKKEFAEYVKSNHGIVVDPMSIYDVQIKRLHAYKRQILDAFNILDLYYRLKEDKNLDIVPRTFFFGAKSSPSYFLAKETIKFINTIAKLINNDMDINGKIKVVFLENYRVSLAERIFPASDISEQISLATKEASGTGNMKFMMNGAVTIATMDGANIEIYDAVGEENIVIFGMREKEVLEYYKNKNYKSEEFYEKNSRLKRIVESLIDGSLGTPKGEFKMIYKALMGENDEYFVFKDFDDYVKAQNKMNELYKDKDNWSKMCLVNIAKSGIFSSDNTIKEYAKDIWNV